MKLKGWKSIFSFTFVQQVKSKSFIISTIIIGVILALIAATANILPAILLDSEIKKVESAAAGEAETLSISNLYIADESGVSPDFSAVADTLGLTVESIAPSQTETKIAELTDSSENAMLAHLFKEEGTFAIEAYYAGENSGVNKDDCTTVSNILSTQLRAQYMQSFGIPEEDIPTVMASVSVSVAQAGSKPTGFVEEMVNMIVPMISSIVLFIFIFSYSQLIAQAIAIEKSSRVMEYLLTSVNPLSIIVGKVLAICLVSLMQFMIMGTAGTVGFLISMPFGIFSKLAALQSAVASNDAVADASGIVNDIGAAFANVNIGTLLVMLLSFILGFLFFALIAGLAGASISKMEDLSAAIQPMSLVGVLGFYLAYMPQIGNMDGEVNIMQKIAWFLPISSPFCLPSAYMLGQIDLPGVLIALLLLLASVVVMSFIVAKVYEYIVLYNGDRLKIADLLKIVKTGE